MNINKLEGKTLINIINKDNEELIFECSDGTKYKMFHYQDCCEDVNIEDICGDIDNLIGSPIIRATEDKSNNNPKSDSDESFTWTFYNISTVKGTVTIRWYGESNGYYSEEVDFEEIK